MSLVVVTPPTALLTLDQAKAHLRVDGNDEDEYLTGLVAAAQGTIDGPMGWLGRCLGPQVLELRAPAFEEAYVGDGLPNDWRSAPAPGLVLPCGPVTEIVSVSYVAVGGAVTVLGPATYVLQDGGLIALAPLALWPSVQLARDAVRVRYRAGYLPTPRDAPAPTLPAPIRHALLVMVGLLYENRLGAADLQTNATVAALLGPFRVWGR